MGARLWVGDGRAEDPHAEDENVLSQARTRAKAAPEIIWGEHLARAVLAHAAVDNVLVERAVEEERGGEERWLVDEAREVDDPDGLRRLERGVRGVERALASDGEIVHEMTLRYPAAGETNQSSVSHIIDVLASTVESTRC